MSFAIKRPIRARSSISSIPAAHSGPVFFPEKMRLFGCERGPISRSVAGDRAKALTISYPESSGSLASGWSPGESSQGVSPGDHRWPLSLRTLGTRLRPSILEKQKNTGTRLELLLYKRHFFFSLCVGRKKETCSRRPFPCLPPAFCISRADDSFNPINQHNNKPATEKLNLPRSGFVSAIFDNNVISLPYGWLTEKKITGF